MDFDMSKLVSIMAVLIPLFIGKASTLDPHRQLRNTLMENYGDVVVRPVENITSTVKVSVRPLFQNLIEMDIKNQQFTIDSWLKLVWTDEFLRWDPDEYGGADTIYLPTTALWIPDITLYENVDLRFQRFKEDTVIRVEPSGTVSWFVPTIFVSNCPIRVQWYPFDTQVCDMTFGSFAYTGDELQLYPETGADAVQTRYLENGVWDMVAVQSKQIMSKFSCCDTPFHEVQYRLLFKRRPDFYIKYLIFPVFLLSILSTLVFYLPPESGEKISLSITNLLSLVVFQQIISDNVPPSGAESPLIGSFFLSMITLVSASVVATIMIIHMSRIAYKPVPSWVRYLVLEKLPRVVCINGVKRSYHHLTRSTVLPFEKCLTSIGVPAYSEALNGAGAANSSGSFSAHNNFDELMKEEAQNQHEWKLVSLVIDRYLMIIFATLDVVITGMLLIFIVIGSDEEFHSEMDILNNSWKMDVNRTL